MAAPNRADVGVRDALQQVGLSLEIGLRLLMLIIIILFVMAILISSCVSKKEFVELQFNERNIPNYRISAVTPSTLFNYNIIIYQNM